MLANKQPQRGIFQILNTIIALSLITMACNVFAAPKAKLWSYWKSSDELNATAIDHSAWQTFLDKYVSHNSQSGINLVNYAQVNDSDKKKLDDYLRMLSQLSVRSYRKTEQFAYWVNFYNAATVQLILDNYPIQSITKISYGIFSFGPWDEKLYTIEQQKVSLNDIEHTILRPIWRDKRIHYAVNCASIGCPNLGKQTFTAENTEALLQKAEKDYITHSRGFRFKGQNVTLSSIYDWYAVDFSDSPKEIIRSFKAFFPGEAEQERFDALLAIPESQLNIEYDYDWNLNKL